VFPNYIDGFYGATGKDTEEAADKGMGWGDEGSFPCHQQFLDPPLAPGILENNFFSLDIKILAMLFRTFAVNIF